MLVLVTGAAGRIGSHLTPALVRQGPVVRALVLPNDPRAAAIAGSRVELHHGRLEDAAAVAAAVQGVEAVFHLGGALVSRGNTDRQFFEYNLRGTFNLLEAVRSHAPELHRFVFASSDAVYASRSGAGACYLPIDEAHPRLAATVYGASKIGAEELCLSYQRGFGIPVTILRFGATADAAELIESRSVFARWLFLRAGIEFLRGLPDPSAAQIEALSILESLVDGDEQLVIHADPDGTPEIREWGDARDVAEGCVRVLEERAAVGEIFNLGGAGPHSSDRLVEHIAQRLDLPFVTARLPTTGKPWYISSVKARGILRYTARRTVFDMVDEAVARL